jgi:hypothetical protein
MYCDKEGGLKKLDLNERATSLAITCNHQIKVYGDAFIGRFSDDESKDWSRLDFGYTDMNSDALWIIETKKQNYGKKMDSYSTSGTMQNLMNNQNIATKTTSSTSSPLIQSKIENAKKIENDVFDCCQTTEEVEIRFKINKNIKPTDLKIIVHFNKLQIKLPLTEIEIITNNLSTTINSKSDLHFLDFKQLIDEKGANLFDKIGVDNSTWNIEEDFKNNKNNEKYVVITLAKTNTNNKMQLLSFN